MGAAHLNTDMLRAELGLRGQYSEETKARIYEELLQRCQTALGRGHPVILDGTFYRKGFRDRIVALARAMETKVRWIEICAAPETVAQRISKKRPDSEADFDVYRKIREEFEPLRVERLQLFSDTQTREAMLTRALEYLGP
jgi:predicted kinase